LSVNFWNSLLGIAYFSFDFDFFRFFLKPEEESNGHEDAATGDPRTFPLSDARALPKRS